VQINDTEKLTTLELNCLNKGKGKVTLKPKDHSRGVWK